MKAGSFAPAPALFSNRFWKAFHINHASLTDTAP
jgi:hypothetical protein